MKLFYVEETDVCDFQDLYWRKYEALNISTLVLLFYYLIAIITIFIDVKLCIRSYNISKYTLDIFLLRIVLLWK